MTVHSIKKEEKKTKRISQFSVQTWLGKRRITIDITEAIRVRPYEVIKPSISITFDVPRGVNLEKFYLMKYKEVKRIWNLHLYNLLYNTRARHAAPNIFDYAEDLVLGKEKFPTFKPKQTEIPNE